MAQQTERTHDLSSSFNNVICQETDAPTYIDTKSDITLGQRNGNDEVENSQEEITIPEESYG